MRSRRILAVAVWAAADLAGLAAGQAPQAAPGAPQNPLVALRTRPTIAEPDRRIIAQWINEQISACAAKNPPDLAAFFQSFMDEFTSSGATDAYKNALADLTAQAFTASITDPANAQGNGALLNALMLRVLLKIQRPAGVNAALAGLNHPSACVRCCAAEYLQTGVAAADQARVAGAIRTAAQKETNAIALREMYRALATLGNSDEAARSILTVLQARQVAYAGRDLRCVGGEVGAAEAIMKLAAATPPPSAETHRLTVRRLAELLKLAVANYMELPADPKPLPQKEARQSLQVVIDTSERALATVVRALAPTVQTPSFAAKMKSSAGADELRLELNRWIGAPGANGVLNQPPFSLPVGLPEIQVAATQPATQPVAAVR